MMFIKAAPNSHGFVTPRDLEELWRDQFDWVYREYDYAVFTMTIHPDVSGKPQVLMMHERLIEHISQHPGVRFATFEEIAHDFAKRYPRNGEARPTLIQGLAARGARPPRARSLPDAPPRAAVPPSQGCGPIAPGRKPPLGPATGPSRADTAGAACDFWRSALSFAEVGLRRHRRFVDSRSSTRRWIDVRPCVAAWLPGVVSLRR